jgi:hypothetical protein
MISINILYGSSCSGKSTIIKKQIYGINKVEMDDCNYWEFYEDEWVEICINFLIENIINNLHKKDIIVTCGALPLPDHSIYRQLEEQYSIKFVHSLILVKDIDNYKSYIKKRKRCDIMDSLLEHYKWRESTKDLYDTIIWN